MPSKNCTSKLTRVNKKI